VQGLFAVLGALLGVVLVPLALTGGTAWLLLPGHLTFAGACAVGAVFAGLDGHPWRARAFGGGYLVASLLIVGALALGSQARDGSWYWMVPWGAGLVWGWVPPLVAGAMGMVGESRRRARTRRVVRKRRRAMRVVAEHRKSQA